MQKHQSKKLGAILKLKLKPYYLSQKQSLPLSAKINMSKQRIRDFYEGVDGKVYIAFSGGKDSTVLLHLVRSIYPNVPAMFVDTGLEYPEIKQFVKTIDNVTTVRPQMGFKKVLETYGYPVISKEVARKLRDLQTPTEKNKKTRHLFATGELNFGKGNTSKSFELADKWKKLFNIEYDNKIGWYSDFHDFKISEQCCNVMKKDTAHRYQKETGRYQIIGTMACDSEQRRLSYLKTTCNSFEGTIQSKPLSFWLQKDIWDYIKENKLSYSKIYDMGEHNTGCMFCMFGVHLEDSPNRFQRMMYTHPKLYKYCMDNLGIKDVLKHIDVEYYNYARLDKWTDNENKDFSGWE